MGRQKNKEVFSLDGKSDTRELKQLIKVLEDLAGGISDLEDSGKDAAKGADAAEDSLGRMADATIIAQGAIGALNAAASVIAPAVDTTIGALLDEEAAMRKVQAQTGLTGAALDDFEQQAEDVFTDGFGDSLTDVTGAMSEVYRITGTTGDELEDFTRKALGIGEAFDKDINETVRTADTLMETFGISNRRAMDLLAHGLQVTGDPADDLLDTFNEYSANFEQMGFDAEQALNLLNQGLLAGARNTDDVADAMREFQIRLMDGTSEEAIRGISTEAAAMYDAFAAGEENAASVFEVIGYELSKIEDPLARNAAGVEIFGTKWEDMGEKVLLSLDPTSSAIGNFNEIEGAADRVGDALESGLVPALQRAGRELQTALNNGLEPFIPALEQGLTNAIDVAVPYITNTLIPGVIKFGRNLGPVVEDVMQFGASIIAAFGGKDAILNAFSTAAGGVATFFDWLATIDISGGLNAFLEFHKILDGILPALQEKATEFFTVENFSNMVSAFGTNLATAIMNGFPVWSEWVNANIIQPILGGMAGLAGMAAQAINDAIPDSIEIEVPAMEVPGTGLFGNDPVVIGGNKFSIPLPANPIPVPQMGDLGDHATGGSFTVPGGGLPMVGTTDNKYMIGLTPGERVNVSPRGGTGGGNMPPLRIVLQMPDGKVLLEQMIDANAMLASGGFVTS